VKQGVALIVGDFQGVAAKMVDKLKVLQKSIKPFVSF
jgi:hypothetical protein